MEVKEKQIYIVLSDSGTWFTRLIRLYTKASLNHASIAFDPELKEVYSFGRKRPGNPFLGGFVREDMQGLLFYKASIAVYSYTVSEDQYLKLRKIIHAFQQESNRYSYNLLGLFCIMLNIRVQRKESFFCSQFVSYIFEQIGVKLVTKCPELTTPTDLERSNFLNPVFHGRVLRK